MHVSLMLAVADAGRASAWYQQALGATEHVPSCRVEVFTDDPDALFARAVQAGANGHDPVRNHEAPWGLHRQGGFIDPFGHRWLVGDRTPLRRYT